MPHLNISPNARGDLQRLYLFLVEKNADIASNAVDAIIAELVFLSQMPKIGCSIQENLREFVIDFGNSGYIALYQLDELLDEVVVLAIRHQLENDYAMKK